MTRRTLLKTAGGITYLALTPLLEAGHFAFGASEDPLLFTAQPYIQPGPNSTLKEDSESVVLAWQTEDRDAAFTVEYGQTPKSFQKATVEQALRLPKTESTTPTNDGRGRRNYSAPLSNLKLQTKYYYRVMLNNTLLAEGYFTTRKKRGTRTRFVAFGDNAHGGLGERAIAFHAYNARPDFIMNTGDNVYSSGLDHEYARNFFPVYNADVPSVEKGAPLLRSVPFYTVLANHDVTDRGPKGALCNFDIRPGSLAYYTHLHLPLNGPEKLARPTPTMGDLSVFDTCAGSRFPRMANYSFDYGDIHFLCLDANTYIDPRDESLQHWIEQDLKSTRATWKFVVYHHPAFNVGEKHYREQHMRHFSPLFERNGVDMVLSGHEHNYQRTMPLKFVPSPQQPEKGLMVPGTFTVDVSFDGKTNTRPKGILYITTGAGGNDLYEPEFTDKPEKWLHPEDNNAAYVSRVISNVHSFTLFDVTRKRLVMTQIDEKGVEVDRIQIDK
ncbi:MAG: metallophosphoesterase [Armatimonas sp.]